ncbi:MAG: DNA-binding response regulator [Nitrospirae bacterium]|nr:MAG: DNA-binding response regulator [Nitrospirota bacterium]
MKSILIADDDPLSRHRLIAALNRAQYDVVEAADGLGAWRVLQHLPRPCLAIIDWMMPGLNGLELCRTIKQSPLGHSTYLILVTAKSSRHDVVSGLEAGADDYIVKPFDADELRARVHVGLRILELQEGLAQRVCELEAACQQIKRLQGLLPICCYCKKIRDDKNYWRQVEDYLSEHAEVQFSHGVCPQCYRTELAPQLKTAKADPSCDTP